MVRHSKVLHLGGDRYWSCKVEVGVARGSHTCKHFVSRMWSGGAREHCRKLPWQKSSNCPQAQVQCMCVLIEWYWLWCWLCFARGPCWCAVSGGGCVAWPFTCPSIGLPEAGSWLEAVSVWKVVDWRWICSGSGLCGSVALYWHCLWTSEFLGEWASLRNRMLLLWVPLPSSPASSPLNPALTATPL